MTAEIGMLEIIHAGAAEIAVREQKAARLDHIDPHPQTGPQPHQATCILWNIGLIQCQTHQILRDQPGRPQLKSRADKAFSAASCRKTLKKRLSILPAQRTSRGAKKGRGARHRVSTVPAVVCGKSSSLSFLHFTFRG